MCDIRYNKIGGYYVWHKVYDWRLQVVGLISYVILGFLALPFKKMIQIYNILNLLLSYKVLSYQFVAIRYQISWTLYISVCSTDILVTEDWEASFYDIFLYFSVFYRYTSNRRLGGLILWYFFISVCSTDILVTEYWGASFYDIFLYFSVFYRYTSNRRLKGLILWYISLFQCVLQIY